VDVIKPGLCKLTDIFVILQRTGDASEIRAKGAGLPVWGISGNVVRIDNVVFQKLCQIIFLGYPDMYELPRSIEGWSWFFPAYGSLLMWILGPIFVF
jgi:hypothetical protein